MDKENVTVKVLLLVLSVTLFQCHTTSVFCLIKIDFPLRVAEVFLEG